MTMRHSERASGYPAASAARDSPRARGELGSRKPAAGHEEGEKPAPLLRIGLDVGELEHLDQVILEAEAVFVELQLEGVLGEARIGAEILGDASASTAWSYSRS